MSIHRYSWVTTVSAVMTCAASTSLRQTFRVITNDPEHHTCWLLASRCQQSRCMVLPLHLCSTVYLPSVTIGYTVKIHRCEYRSSVMTPITWVIDVCPTADTLTSRQHVQPSCYMLVRVLSTRTMDTVHVLYPYGTVCTSADSTTTTRSTSISSVQYRCHHTTVIPPGVLLSNGVNIGHWHTALVWYDVPY